MRHAYPEKKSGRILAALAVLVAGLLAFPQVVPNLVGNLGSLLETFLPWLGLAVPVLLALALLRRSAVGAAAVALPATVWAVLAPGYPHHAVVGTVGLWSAYPLTGTRPVDIKPADVEADWNRGLRSTVRMPSGEVAVYVAHLPSVRLGLPDGFASGRRDESAAALGAAIAAERLNKVILLGDLNGTLDDRGLAPIVSRLTPAKGTFSWPAAFPLARIDHVMTRAATPLSVIRCSRPSHPVTPPTVAQNDPRVLLVGLDRLYR
jgi:hypothetical protein